MVERTQAEEILSERASGGTDERIPVMQQILENPFLLLFLGVALPTVIYIVWGVMEIASIPLSQ